MDDTKTNNGRSLALGQSQALVRIMDRARAITAELKDDNERACFKAILGRHPELLVKGLSAHYPLDADLLDDYADEWDWEGLSENPSLPWSLDVTVYPPNFSCRTDDHQPTRHSSPVMAR
jgi:hypothetical protein